jgi:UDP-glucuronate decarboxylase
MRNKFYFLDEDVKKIHQHVDFSEMKNKSILITGATGLIGLYLLLSLKDIFIEYNIKITIIYKSKIDDLFKCFIDFDKIECINEDITDIKSLESKLGTYDYIIHSAGYGQPNRFLENELKTIELNTSSTLFLFKKLNTNGKFLFVSSSEVYSGIDNNQTESVVGRTTPEHNRACYIEGKKCGETICNIYRKSGVNAKSVRLSLAYGPGTKINDKRVLTNFIEKSILDKEIKLLDNGSSIRTYIYVADAIIMFWKILFEGKQNVYNVGGIQPKSIFNIAKKIASLMNVEVIKPNTEHTLTGSPKSVKIDLKRYKEEFGFFDFESIENGLKKTIEWHKILYQNK